MNIIYSLVLSLIAGISTLLGGFIIFFKYKDINKFISSCLCFTATIMIGLSIFELIPESFIILINKYNFFYTILIILLCLILSYFIINYINSKINNTNNIYKIGILNMIVLMLHNFPEGITTFITSYHNIDLGIKVTIAIALHNIPEGISIATPIYIATKSRAKALLITLISGLSEPLGAIFAYIFFKNYINSYFIAYILIIIAALMIVLSIEKILPRAIEYKKEKALKNGFIIGILLLFISLILL